MLQKSEEVLKNPQALTEQEEYISEQLEDYKIKELIANTIKKLKLTGYYIISKDLNQRLWTNFKNIDM